MKTTGRNKKEMAAKLPEMTDDKSQLLSSESIFELPDVEDIPGQEHIRPMPSGEMADTTISSAGDEAKYLLDRDVDEIMDQNNENVTDEERELLQQTSESMASPDDQSLLHAHLDNIDEDGTPLNEKSDQSGSELDVPGSELDDANEEIGEEDEENNSYSHSGQDD